MTVVNHRRKNKKPINQRFEHYHNGYGGQNNKLTTKEFNAMKFQEKTELAAYSEMIGRPVVTSNSSSRGVAPVGRTDFLDKSMHGWSRTSVFANVTIAAAIGNDFHNGHRGMAKAVRGAKKYVRTRIRFHENTALRKVLLKELDLA